MLAGLLLEQCFDAPNAACNLRAKSGSLRERAPSMPKRAFSMKLMRAASVAISTD